MNPLLLTGYGISIDVNKAHLTIKQKESVMEFEPHRIPYDYIIIDGHYGSISFEAMMWLSKYDVFIVLLNWNENLLSNTILKETLNAQLKVKQNEKYLNPESRLYIACQIVKQKVRSSLSLLNALSNFYDIDFSTINKEIERVNYNNINSLMMYESRIASAYWSELTKIFNFLARDFHFEGRKNLSY